MWNSLYLAIAAVFLVQGETSGQLAVGIPEPVTAAMASTTTAMPSTIAAVVADQPGGALWPVAIIVVVSAAFILLRKRL